MSCALVCSDRSWSTRVFTQVTGSCGTPSAPNRLPLPVEAVAGAHTGSPRHCTTRRPRRPRAAPVPPTGFTQCFQTHCDRVSQVGTESQ